MDLFITIVLFAIGILFILKGGDWFVDASSSIAEATGIPKFIIGATIVSVATTLPELIVSVMAAVEGKVEMAIGNAVGSAICNVALILAITLVLAPLAMKRKDFMPKGILLLVTLLTLWVLTMGGTLNVVGIVILFLLFAAFIVENIRGAKNGITDEERTKFTKSQWGKNLGLFAMGAVGIVVGSQLLVANGSKLAELVGIPESVIGLTMIAIGTSLPELVTAIIAVKKKEGSLAVGNILGANLINTALILPICALIGGGTLAVSSQNIYFDIPMSLLVAAIVLVPSFITQKFQRWQGITLLVLYSAYTILLFI